MKPNGISREQWFRYNLYFFVEHFLGLKNFNKHFGKGRKELYDEIDSKLKDSNRGKILDIPLVYGEISQSDMKAHLKNTNEPVIFKSVAKDWPCCKKWSFDFFAENFGDEQIAIIDNVGVTDRNKPQEYEITTYAKYVSELKKGSTKYLKFSRIMDEAYTLRKDFDLAFLKRFHLPTTFGQQFFMFMGNTESMTPVHCGFANTVFIQVTGKKKWILWAPNERIFFDPRAERRSYNFSHVDPYVTNDPNFPLYKYARRYEVILEPGDILFFPSHLWHQVENVEGGVSVAYKIVHLPTNFRSSFILTTLAFLATRPNMLLDVFYHRFKKSDYLFTRSQKEIK